MRALIIVVLAILAVGSYAAFSGVPAHAASPGGGATTNDFGYALAAGAIALAATILVSRPRMRFRR